MSAEGLVDRGTGELVSSRLVPLLETAGFDAIRIFRPWPSGSGVRLWKSLRSPVDASRREGAQALNDLPGTTVDGERWSDVPPRVIGRSGLDATVLPVRTILKENVPTGLDFSQLWVRIERLPPTAPRAGVRVVYARFGKGKAVGRGKLALLNRLFGLSLGGCSGNREQFKNWIDSDDLVREIAWLVNDLTLVRQFGRTTSGQSLELTEAFDKALRRATAIPATVFYVEAVMGKWLKTSFR